MEKFKERQKNEALKRLEMFTKRYNLNDMPLKIFKKGDFALTNQTSADLDYKQVVSVIKNFQEKNNVVVFYSIITPLKLGNVINMLYISQYEEDWHLSIPDSDDYVYAATYNLNDNYFELGFIKVDVEDNMLVRVG